MKFVDEARILLKAGNGGNGCVSFYRGPHLPKGGPDGGNGARGGSIYFEASRNVQTLLDFKYKPEYKAKRGGDGQGSNCNGRSAEDITLLVPCGTTIRSSDGFLDIDLVEDGQRVLAVEGGKGGKGNTTFKSSTRQAPRIATPGEEGEQREVFLELKSLSDVGLVGFPNAGKSSLLRALSAARPKVADYPFTTLQPQLGMVNNNSFVLADIPGLIEGAHQNQGLGHRFLKHISRSRVLTFVLSFETERSLEKSLQILRAELGEFNPELLEKDFLIVVNKSDLLDESEDFRTDWENFKAAHPESLLISATQHQGLEELIQKLEDRLFVSGPAVIESKC